MFTPGKIVLHLTHITDTVVYVGNHHPDVIQGVKRRGNVGFKFSVKSVKTGSHFQCFSEYNQCKCPRDSFSRKMVSDSKGLLYCLKSDFLLKIWRIYPLTHGRWN